ncbi:MAG: hypothetical protein Q9184_005535 [Pyrenodesmia sp. 2 TL-2023]
MDKAKVQKLIRQLEQHQQSQIECLRTLFELGGQGEAEGVVKDEVQDMTLNTDNGTGVILENTEIPSASDISSASVLDVPPQEDRVQIPEEWAMPWSNALLRQRIREREKEPGCGGGLRRSKWSGSSEVAVINAFTPSATSTVLLCAAKDHDSSITFDSQGRQNFLFEDRNFSNSKRYFWALQSLRLFAEHMEITLRSLDGIVLMAGDLDASEAHDVRDEVLKDLEEKFGKLRDRIERKRQEIQSLSDGLFSASSVAEGRLASEQNGNIRLLTMVTIAYLPLTLASSIYGMDVLPKSAGFSSYIIVTVLMCAITYVLVLKLRQIKETISWVRSILRSILHNRKNQAPVERAKNHERASQAATRASSMA